nr:MAG TPA: hypothetical protein [Caudoviricetes sp.]DAW72164.1 MAG TPA: hypothetical protein [Caudoviricetes sp.]
MEKTRPPRKCLNGSMRFSVPNQNQINLRCGDFL